MLDYDAIRSMFHLKDDVLVDDMIVHVSTVDLSLSGFTSSKGFETCLFWKDESEVVEWYATSEQAAAGHAAWKREAVLFYTLEGIRKR